MPTQQIDLRPLEHGRRHGLVFAAFDALEVGSSFEIINDHDPFPLRTQMEFMRTGQLDWEYLEQGPHAFRVRITRLKAASGNGPKATAADSSVYTRF